MIITKEVEVILNPRYIKYWEDKGYKIPRYYNKEHGWCVARNAKIKVKIEDLSKKSHILVECKCESCGNKRWIDFCQYRDICEECNRKIRKGEKHPNFGKKMPKELIEKQRRTKEAKGTWVNIEKLDDFLRYRRIVKNETKKWKEKLFENWDGLDYYTKEKLITNEEFRKINLNIPLNKNLLQPTIDHKISIIYGYKNNKDALEIGSLKNLCICGKQNNSKKSYLTEIDYKNLLGG